MKLQNYLVFANVAHNFGNLGKINSGNILVGNHAAIFIEINSPRFFFFRLVNVCVGKGKSLEYFLRPVLILVTIVSV